MTTRDALRRLAVAVQKLADTVATDIARQLQNVDSVSDEARAIAEGLSVADGPPVMVAPAVENNTYDVCDVCEGINLQFMVPCLECKGTGRK